MKIATGRVVDGKVILEGVPLLEGAVVTVVISEEPASFDTTADEEGALLEAVAQADRGQVISWDRLRARLRQSA